MGRGSSFSAAEVDLIIKYFDSTIAELEEIFRREGYNRSRKSIARKLEKLRESGEIGYRGRATIKRSYRQRGRRDNPKPVEDGGFGPSDWGDSEWDTGSSLDNGEDWK